MSLVDLINALEEVPEPPPIAMTPQTPGWIVLGLLLIVACIGLGLRAFQHWQADAYRRAALAELEDAGNDATRIAEILRRTALVAFPRRDVVPLFGEAWLAFLDSTYPGEAFVSGPGRSVATAPFQAHPVSPELKQVATDWVRRHTRSTAA